VYCICTLYLALLLSHYYNHRPSVPEYYCGSVVAVVSTTRGRHSSIDPFPISFPLLNFNLPLFLSVFFFFFAPFVSSATASLSVSLYLSLFQTIRSLLYFTPATSSKRHDDHHHHHHWRSLDVLQLPGTFKSPPPDHLQLLQSLSASRCDSICQPLGCVLPRSFCPRKKQR